MNRQDRVAMDGRRWTTWNLRITWIAMAVAVFAGAGGSEAFAQRMSAGLGQMCEAELTEEDFGICAGIPGCQAGMDPVDCPEVDFYELVPPADVYGPRPRIYTSTRAPQADPVWRGKQLVYEIDVCNLGNRDLELEIIACGARITGPSKRTLGAGEGDIVRLAFETGLDAGETDKFMMFKTNDPCWPEVRIPIHTNVLRPLIAEPEVAKLGMIDPNAEVVKTTYVLRRGDAGPIEPSIMRVRLKGMEAKIREITPGEHYELDTFIRPPYPNGPIRTSVWIGTGVPQVPRMVLHLLAGFPIRIQTTPEVFTLPQVATAPVESVITLRWNGVSGYKVVHAGVNVSELTTRVEHVDDGSERVILQAPAGFRYQRGMFPAVTVQTDDPQMPELSFAVTFR